MMDSSTQMVEAPLPMTEKPKKARKGKPNGHARPARPARSRKNGHAHAQAPRRGRAARDELKVSEMTPDELAIMRHLYTPKGPREGKAIHEIQEAVFGKDKKHGTSRTRNNLRRLVKFGWLELQEHTAVEMKKHEAEGGRLYSKYRLTEKGRKRGLKAD